MTDSSRMNELNGALSEKVAQNQEIADAVEVVDGTMQIDAAHREVFQANMAEIKQIKGPLDDLNVMGAATAASVAAEFAAKGAGEAISAAEYSSMSRRHTCSSGRLRKRTPRKVNSLSTQLPQSKRPRMNSFASRPSAHQVTKVDSLSST